MPGWLLDLESLFLAHSPGLVFLGISDQRGAVENLHDRLFEWADVPSSLKTEHLKASALFSHHGTLEGVYLRTQMGVYYVIVGDSGPSFARVCTFVLLPLYIFQA